MRQAVLVDDGSLGAPLDRRLGTAARVFRQLTLSPGLDASSPFYAGEGSGVLSGGQLGPATIGTRTLKSTQVSFVESTQC
jgi:hypothetical protein